jgi:hypothetical protein
MADLTPQHYEVKQSWWVVSPQEQLNKQLEEQRQIIIKWMDDDLKSGWKYEQIKWDLKYEVVWNIWIVIYKWKPHSFYKYSKENWVEYYTNIKWIQKDEDLQFALGETWYDLKDWKLYKNWQEIQQFLWNWKVNPEFVKSIDDINFFTEIQWVFWAMKTVIKWWKLWNFNIHYFNSTIIAWVTRIKDVMYFAWKWYIPESEISKLLTRAIQELPNQCSDTRFYQNWKWQKLWMEVTKDELDQYLKPAEWKPLITQSMYDNCLKRIEARDRKINGMNWVKEQWKTERDIWKTQIWVVWKVKSILWF